MSFYPELEASAQDLSTFANQPDPDNVHHREATEAEDPLVSLVTKDDPYPKDDLIKMFPQAFSTTAPEGYIKLTLKFLNQSLILHRSASKRHVRTYVLCKP